MSGWRAVDFTQVTIDDRFWAPRRQTNRSVSLTHSLEMLERSGTLGNFDRAAAGARDGFAGMVFQDSDAYKVVEACAYSLATDPDPALDARLDSVIARIAAAQAGDGYLNTWYQVNDPDRRFTNLRDDHELYCAGHLFEAAVAHVRATGKRTLLDVALRLADLLCDVFLEHAGYGGHPEIELALVKLADVAQTPRYAELARRFVERRGAGYFADEHATPRDAYRGEYWQDNAPIREHRRIVGHAVRAAYLFAGVTDVVARTPDPGLEAMLDRVWANTVHRNTYVTGGIGSSGSNEGFTRDYDLPNATAYQETCASIALIFWAERMNRLRGDAHFADVLERALYNGALAGVSLDGTRFFYSNPLASDGTRHRSEWFGCACCPPNIARLLASLGGYAYASTGDGIAVNLYVQGGAQIDGVRLTVATDYPWDGKIALTLAPDAPREFTLRLRIPAWCDRATLAVNGEPATLAVEKGYARVTRVWSADDTVTLDLPMPIRRTIAHPRVADDRGKHAIERGPLVYCVEGIDALALPIGADLALAPADDLYPGALGIVGVGLVGGGAWPGGLYAPALAPAETDFRAIPYALWGNGAPGPMAVWLPTAPPPAPTAGPERSATVAVSFQSDWCKPDGVRDGREPSSSSDRPARLCHFWPRKGGVEWVRYDWPKPVTLTGARLYFYDDTGHGDCRPPAAWRLAHGPERTPIALTDGAYAAATDRWVEVGFTPVTTDSLWLELEQPDGFSVGVLQWQLETPDTVSG